MPILKIPILEFSILLRLERVFKFITERGGEEV